MGMFAINLWKYIILANASGIYFPISVLKNEHEGIISDVFN